jgi:hypothetical protein
MVFTFENDNMEMIPLAHALRTVRNAAREWLYASGAWDRDDPDAWYNEDDYTLGMRDYFYPDEWAFIKERRSRDPLAVALAAALAATEDAPAT